MENALVNNSDKKVVAKEMKSKDDMLDLIYHVAFISFFALISACMVGYWGYFRCGFHGLFMASVLSFIISFYVFWGIFHFCIPKDGISGNLVGYWMYSIISFFFFILLMEGKIISIMTGG